MGGVVAIGVHSASPGIQRFTNFQWILQRRFWIFVSVNRFGLLGVQSEQLRIRDISTIRGIQGGTHFAQQHRVLETLNWGKRTLLSMLADLYYGKRPNVF